MWNIRLFYFLKNSQIATEGQDLAVIGNKRILKQKSNEDAPIKSQIFGSNYLRNLRTLLVLGPQKRVQLFDILEEERQHNEIHDSKEREGESRMQLLTSKTSTY